MNRKDFLKIAPAGGVALMLNGFSLRSVAAGTLRRLLGKPIVANSNNRVMVFIQLNGGNDGLNTIIPIDQYSGLSEARGNILIPEKSVLALAGIENTGMHPSMTGLQQLYNAGMVNIVQGVSYPNPSLSHFRAADILLTGSDTDQFLRDGWLGRYLSEENPDFPIGYPNTNKPDPLAIEIGNTISAAFTGPAVSMGTSVSDIDSFYNLVGNTVSAAPATPAGHELTFLRFVAQQTQQYTGSLQKAAGKAKNLSSKYPAGNPLADQLKIVARLIAGGLQTPIYFVSMYAFDTHSGQVDSADSTQGTHANLLKSVSEAVTAFFDDCSLLKVEDRVCAMTFSEFGRRIKSNGALGTDHGTAAPVMVFGKQVNSGIIGTNPVINTNVTSRDNLEMQFDYRSIYASVMEDWFGADSSEADRVLLQNYPTLPIFKKSPGLTLNEDTILFQNYPNPFQQTTTIRFISDGGTTEITLMNNEGRLIQYLAKGIYDTGFQEFTFQRNGLPSGLYYYKFKNQRTEQVKMMEMM